MGPSDLFRDENDPAKRYEEIKRMKMGVGLLFGSLLASVFQYLLGSVPCLGQILAMLPFALIIAGGYLTFKSRKAFGGNHQRNSLMGLVLVGLIFALMIAQMVISYNIAEDASGEDETAGDEIEGEETTNGNETGEGGTTNGNETEEEDGGELIRGEDVVIALRIQRAVNPIMLIMLLATALAYVLFVKEFARDLNHWLLIGSALLIITFSAINVYHFSEFEDAVDEQIDGIDPERDYTTEEVTDIFSKVQIITQYIFLILIVGYLLGAFVYYRIFKEMKARELKVLEKVQPATEK